MSQPIQKSMPHEDVNFTRDNFGPSSAWARVNHHAIINMGSDTTNRKYSIRGKGRGYRINLGKNGEVHPNRPMKNKRRAKRQWRAKCMRNGHKEKEGNLEEKQPSSFPSLPRPKAGSKPFFNIGDKERGRDGRDQTREYETYVVITGRPEMGDKESDLTILHLPSNWCWNVFDHQGQLALLYLLTEIMEVKGCVFVGQRTHPSLHNVTFNALEVVDWGAIGYRPSVVM
nr:hypothetical protein [Tanacetum cinerariifolium]